MGNPCKALVGIVGYTPVLDPYPLGPRLMARLTAALADVEDVRIENMSWGPIHIVQQFQDADAPTLDRIILVGAAAVSRSPGQVQAFEWKGGKQPPAAIQERIYEAVTGIVDIENTLMIGEHFGIWPPECYSVEADIPADIFGRIVMAESQGRADNEALKLEFGFSPDRMIAEIVEATADLVRSGGKAKPAPQSKFAHDLAPLGAFMRNVPVGAN